LLYSDPSRRAENFTFQFCWQMEIPFGTVDGLLFPKTYSKSNDNVYFLDAKWVRLVFPSHFDVFRTVCCTALDSNVRSTIAPTAPCNSHEYRREVTT